MKRLSILICTLLLVSTSVNAQKKGGKKTKAKATPTRTVQKQVSKPAVQEPQEEKFRFGIRAGGNIAKITGKDKTRIFNERVGYFGGFVAKYAITNKINIQSEAYYNLLGTSAKYKDDFTYKGKARLSYISIPILGQYEITPQFYAETGPEVSFNIGSKYKERNGKDIYDWKNITKTATFAWAIGAGYYFTDNVGVNLRANIGLGSPFKPETKDDRLEDFRHLSFQLGMIYLF